MNENYNRPISRGDLLFTIEMALRRSPAPDGEGRRTPALSRGLVDGLMGGLAVPFAFELAVEPPGKVARGFDDGVLGVDDQGLSARRLVTLDLDDALGIRDKLNRRLGLGREAWTAMVAASMHAEDEDPESRPWH